MAETTDLLSRQPLWVRRFESCCLRNFFNKKQMNKIKNPLITFNDNVEKIIVSKLKSLIDDNIINISETKKFIIYNIAESDNNVRISIQKSNDSIYIDDVKLVDVSHPFESYLMITNLVNLLELYNCQNFLSEKNALEMSMLNIFDIMSEMKFFSFLCYSPIYRINNLKKLKNKKLKLFFDKADNFKIEKKYVECDDIIDVMLLSFDIFNLNKIIKIVDKSNELKKISEWFVSLR